MHVKLKFVASPCIAQDVNKSRHVCLIGRSADVIAAIPKASAGFLTEANAPLLASLVSPLKPSAEHGATSSTVLPTSFASGATESTGSSRFSFAITPTVASRHNSPLRSDAIDELVRRQVDEADKVVRDACHCLVYVLPAGVKLTATAVAVSAAIARAFPTYSLKSSEDTTREVTVCVSFFDVSTGAFQSGAVLEQAAVVAKGVRAAAAMVDEPTNKLNTSSYLAEVRKVVAELQSEGHPVTLDVIEGEELRERGFGGIYGVGRAAEHPPALAVLSYTPAEPVGEPVAWVGKGIVYDTGGLSIKGKDSMPGMKRDMGGSAAIFRAFEGAVRLKHRGTLHALLCLAENSVGPLATRPDDIHTLYSGRTVEINNTDAEGRLVLGDGVWYAAHDLNVSLVVDMCTLTGAQGIATGQRFASIVSNRDAVEERALVAAKLSGDLAHPMPYCPEFFKSEFASVVADMKNSVKNRSNAQVSCASQFIANHLGDWLDTGDWLHIDMAAPAHRRERGTGYGVALLLQMFVLAEE